jgi:calcium-dependent protein kinase
VGDADASNEDRAFPAMTSGNVRKACHILRHRFFLEHAEAEGTQFSDAYDMCGPALGEGSFGCVRRARLRVDSSWAEDSESKPRGGPVRAIKSIRKRGQTGSRLAQREIAILRRLDHPHICRLFETFETCLHVYLVLEYLDGTELYYFIQDGGLEESFASRIARQVLSALRYCHSRHVVHRDLKPENIMVERPHPSPSPGLDATSNLAAVTEVKLIDFGLATLLRGQTARCSSRSLVGTYEYCAPEVRHGGRAAPAGDLWSLGMVVHALLIGGLPSEPVRDGRLLLDTGDAPYRLLSALAKDILHGLLHVDPRRRLSASEASREAWVNHCVDNLTVSGKAMTAAAATMAAFVAFHQSAMIRRAILTALAQHATTWQLAMLKDQFLAINRNGDGKITREELTNWVMNNLLALGSVSRFAGDAYGAAHEWVDCVFDSVDTDGSRYIEYTEFCAAALPDTVLQSEEALRAAFRVFDADNSGKIKVGDFCHVLSFAPADVPLLSLDSALDCGGALDFEDFKIFTLHSTHQELGNENATISGESWSDKSPTDLTVTTTASADCDFGSLVSVASWASPCSLANVADASPSIANPFKLEFA